MNIDILNKFYLGNGGIGDFLIFLSTFYDNNEKSNIIFLANNPDEIKSVARLFPKLDKKLILKNSFDKLKEFYYNKNCIGTGILPKDLDYNNWYKVNIFKDYNVKEFPDFINLFEPKKIHGKQIFVQKFGSKADGELKHRILLESTLDNLKKEYSDYEFVFLDDFQGMSYSEIFSHIRGSDIVIGVDSFVKTFSAMSRINTIVYDNIYLGDYLSNFKDNIDYGHYVFLFNWNFITLRKQNFVKFNTIDEILYNEPSQRMANDVDNKIVNEILNGTKM